MVITKTSSQLHLAMGLLATGDNGTASQPVQHGHRTSFSPKLLSCNVTLTSIEEAVASKPHSLAALLEAGLSVCDGITTGAPDFLSQPGPFKRMLPSPTGLFCANACLSLLNPTRVGQMPCALCQSSLWIWAHLCLSFICGHLRPLKAARHRALRMVEMATTHGSLEAHCLISMTNPPDHRENEAGTGHQALSPGPVTCQGSTHRGCKHMLCASAMSRQSARTPQGASQ